MSREEDTAEGEGRAEEAGRRAVWRRGGTGERGRGWGGKSSRQGRGPRQSSRGRAHSTLT